MHELSHRPRGRCRVDIGGILTENICIKINKMPGFYVIIARKCPNFAWRLSEVIVLVGWGDVPPSPLVPPRLLFNIGRGFLAAGISVFFSKDKRSYVCEAGTTEKPFLNGISRSTWRSPSVIRLTRPSTAQGQSDSTVLLYLDAIDLLKTTLVA